MWPILILSIITFGVVIERALFLLEELKTRDPAAVQKIFKLAEQTKLEEATRLGMESQQDMVARVLTFGLAHRETSLSEAMLEQANTELERYNRGLVVLDTAVTLGPLLGLLGTVLGMIHSFGIVGAAELTAQQRALTGGIAESLIAVTFGLSVAIVAIIPLNYLNARLEHARRRLESAMTQLELIVLRHR